jgi:hypothetical protein
VVGRKPMGDRAMSNAERQARFRAAHADGAPTIHCRKPAGRRTRPQRWLAAVAELVDLQAEYQDWFDNLPEFARNSPTGEALQAVCDLDLSELASVELPRGFGRD